jgi:hypothetical protein
MAAITIIGPQFGGKTIRTHVDLPKRSKMSIRRMTTSDLKVAQAILSEELRLVWATVRARVRSGSSLGDILRSIRLVPFGWDATDRQIRAMEGRLAEIGDEITRRNLRDLENGRTAWTRPRHARGTFAVSLAEAAKVH